MSQIARDHQPGPAPAVVMIHGWTCQRSNWQDQYRALAGRHELLTADLPGHGETPPDDREDWSMQAFARDVLAVMDETLSSESAILVGHSMGGTVALEAAAMAPDRIKGVILVDTFLINYGALTPDDVNGFYQPFAEDFVEAMSGLVENTTGPRADASLRRQLKQEMGSADPDWALKAWDRLLNWDPAPIINALRCPVHAINCPLIPDETRERLAPWISETVIPDTGHFLHMEAPDEFNAALENTLARVRA